MRILITSDGSRASEDAARFAALIAAPLHAEATVLGIEEGQGEGSLAETLQRIQAHLKEKEVNAEVVILRGHPLEEILRIAQEPPGYDLVVIGGSRQRRGRAFVLIGKALRIIRQVDPPVLLVLGPRTTLHRILLLSGGSRYNRHSIDLAGKIAHAASAQVTLLHVLPGPPPIFAGLIRMEEDLDRLLRSSSREGRILKSEKEALERTGAAITAKLRHGDLIEEGFKEVHLGDYDLLVAGSCPEEGAIRIYVLGDLARELLNRADCPVLIAREEREERVSLLGALGNLIGRLLGGIARRPKPEA